MTLLWVIEMKFGDTWKPTIGVGLTRAEAREKKKFWAIANPTDTFRVVKYIRKDSQLISCPSCFF